MNLTGTQIKQLHGAICSAYSESELQLLIRTEMEKRLDVIAGGANLSEIVSALIEWAERTGQISTLIDAICGNRPENSDIKSLCEDSESWFAGDNRGEANFAEQSHEPVSETSKEYTDNIPRHSGGDHIYADVGENSRNVNIGKEIRSVTIEGGVNTSGGDFVAGDKTVTVNLPSVRLPFYEDDTGSVDFSWFEKNLDLVKADLDERYNPDDHVEVDIGSVFHGLTCSRIFRNGLRSSFDSGVSINRLRHTVAQLSIEPDEKILNSIDGSISKLQNFCENIPDDLPSSLPYVDWKQAVDECIQHVELLGSWVRGDERDRENPRQNDLSSHYLYQAREIVSELMQYALSLQARLNHHDTAANQTRVLLVVGEAGTGKSHLLADVVAKAIERKELAILFLGQYFRDGDLWQTILHRCDLSGASISELLETLNLAAKASRVRCLIAVDALNEANDLKNWQDHIGSFVEKILQYDNLVLCISCRPEYEKIFITESLASKLTKVECRGFVTLEEQEMAARQYMEKRGIIRPSVPWLAPEFTNPLFIRTCCDALHRTNQREFPRGLRGIGQLIRFYIDNIAKKLETQYPQIDFPNGCVNSAFLKCADRMANDRNDRLSRQDVTGILSECFESIGPSYGQTWLSIFLTEGILRKEHDFSHDVDDPLSIQNEVYLFSYQRFSDHLIVTALMEPIADIESAFVEGGPLSFIITDTGIDWAWQNLLPALSIQIPEKYAEKEFVDLLPGDFAKWWRYYCVKNAFAESILWRSSNAFSQRTYDLFNLNDREGRDERITLLLQLSTVKEHPWNASFLDKNLRSWAMPERDATWSLELANITEDEQFPIHTLIDWALRADKTMAEDEVLRLTSLTLTWCLSTSSRPIRDRATKALAKVLVERPHLFLELLQRFIGIDDLYILERLCAAGYSAVCHGMGNDSLVSISQVVYDEIFKSNAPPLNLLTRDYALGIIEYAHTQGCLPDAIDVNSCLPPYNSQWPIEDVTEEELDEIREFAGGSSIFHSAFSWGEWGRKVIEPHIRDFTAIPLAGPKPLNDEQKLDRFREMLNEWSIGKRTAFVKLEKGLYEKNNRVRDFFYNAEEPVDQNETAAYENTVQIAEEYFVSLLSVTENALYTEYALPALFPDRIPHQERGIPKFDIQHAKRWITQRAYGFGWTKELFPREPGYDLGGERPLVERVGKKYQWLALSELMARLADNVWMTYGWRNEAFVYRMANQIGYVRDIEPTIFQIEKGGKTINKEMWWCPHSIDYQDESDESVAKWPFGNRDLLNDSTLIDIQSNGEWLVLQSFYGASERFDDDGIHRRFRRSAFVRVSSIIVPADNTNSVVAALQNERLTDSQNWEPIDAVDGPFYGEFPWRQTWRGTEYDWGTGSFGTLKNIYHIMPVIEHIWEDHLDTSLPTGSHICLPSVWLARQLNLGSKITEPGQFRNSNNELVFYDPSVGTNHSSAALINRHVFLDFLRENNLECLWIVAGEKSTSPTGTDREWGRRWHSAIYRWLGNDWARDFWYEDQARGLEKYNVEV